MYYTDHASEYMLNKIVGLPMPRLIQRFNRGNTRDWIDLLFGFSWL